ncbi:MAG: hypothetical protein HQL31_01645, partial [Planctomycetes bacterium]|nr:hypothetical protein [Planctomycetota bacterium]
MNARKLLLIDSMALAFRAHYAFIHHPLSRADGFVTSALYGVTNTLFGVLEQIQPTHVAAALDTGRPNFRHEMFPQYKANRPPCPEELSRQLERLADLIRGFGIPALSADGVEADDLIGTWALRGEKEGYEVLILSGDKDFCQLISPRIRMLSPTSADGYNTLDEEGVKTKFGVTPAQIVDYLALLGDRADNVPGAPGIGKVTAVKLLAEHGDLDHILAAAPSFKSAKLTSIFQDHREQIELSRKLVSICTDVAGLPDCRELAFTGIDRERLLPLLEEFEFPRLVAKLMRPTVPQEVRGEVPGHYERITTTAALDTLLCELSGLSTPPDLLLLADEAGPHGPPPLGLALTTAPERSFFVSFLDEDSPLSARAVLQMLMERLPGGAGAFDMKNALHLLRRAGAKIPAAYDSSLESSILFPGQAVDLSSRTAALLGWQIPSFGQKRLLLRDVPEEELGQLAASHARASALLHRRQQTLLGEAELLFVYEKIELPLLPIIAEMEVRGIALDPQTLADQAHGVETELEELSRAIHTLAGEVFNINSNQQLGIVLFEKMKIQEQLGLKEVKKTKTGYATNQAILEMLKPHPIAAKLLDYRFLAKLLNTYLLPLPRDI